MDNKLSHRLIFLLVSLIMVVNYCYAGNASLDDILIKLDDTKAYVRVEALQSLYGYRDEKIAKIITTKIHDKIAIVRAKAIMLLGDWGYPTDLPLIETCLDDPSSEVRLYTLVALRHFETDKDIIEKINKIMQGDTDNEVMTEAAISLGILHDERAIKPLCEYLRQHPILTSRSEETTRKSVDVINVLSKYPVTKLSLLLEFLKSTNDNIRYTGVSVLMSMRCTDSLDLLQVTLSDRLPMIRSLTIKALGQLGNSPTALQLILNQLSDSDNTVREACMKAVSNFMDLKVINTIKIVLHDPSPIVRVNIAHLAGIYPGNVSRLLLASLAEDKDTQVKARAYISIGKNHDLTRQSQLITAMRNDDIYLRNAAAIGLAYMENDKALPIVVDAIADPRLYLDACDAVVALGTVSIDEIYKRLDNGDNATKVKYLSVLTKIPDSRNTLHLLDLLDTCDRQQLGYIIEILGCSKDTRAVPSLVKLMNYEDENIRHAAIISLCRIGDIRILDKAEIVEKLKEFPEEYCVLLQQAHRPLDTKFLEALLNNADRNIRKKALKAIAGIKYSGFNGYIYKLLHSHDKLIQRLALQCLWMNIDQPTVDTIENDLTDNEILPILLPLLRNHADKNAVDSLLRIAKSNDNDEKMRVLAIEALAHTGDERANSCIINALNKLSNDQYRAQIVIALQNLSNNIPICKKLKDIFQESQGEMKRTAALALWRAGDEIGKKFILSQFDTNNFEAIMCSLLVCHEMKCHEAIPYIDRLLTTDDYNLVINAIELLGDIGDATYNTKILKECLKSPLRDIRIAAINALSKIEGEKVIDILVDCFQHERQNIVKRAIIAALGKLKSDKSIVVLQDMLKNNKDQFVNSEIRLILSSTTDK